MIVRNFNIMRSICLPNKADSILVIDSNALLTSPVSLQRFQPVPRWDAKVFQIDRSFDLIQFAERNHADRLPASIDGKRSVLAVFTEKKSADYRLVVSTIPGSVHDRSLGGWIDFVDVDEFIDDSADGEIEPDDCLVQRFTGLAT